jgi:periplasmic protein CpxP/Spy
MKKVLMIITVAVLSITANAQKASSAPAGGKSKMDHPDKGKHLDPTQRATKLTEFMTRKLLLSEAQKKDVFNINLDKAKRIEALHAENKIDKKDMMAKRKVIEQERDAEFRRVFSTEQYDKWIKLKEKKKKDKKDKKEKHEQNENNKPNKGKDEKDKDDDADGDLIDQMEKE